MQIKNRYIKCFSVSKKKQLEEAGFLYLFEKNGVYWFENNYNEISKFNNSDNNKDLLNGVKYSIYIPM